MFRSYSLQYAVGLFECCKRSWRHVAVSSYGYPGSREHALPGEFAQQVLVGRGVHYTDLTDRVRGISGERLITRARCASCTNRLESINLHSQLDRKALKH